MINVPSKMDVPLQTQADGTIRVGQSRVLLEIVIHAFKRGETPEGIVQSFPTLKLEDVYAVIAYYLQHQTEVDRYIQQADAESKQVRQTFANRQPDMVGLRERLMKRLEDNNS